MDIAKAFEVAFNRKKEKNWEKIYVVVDIQNSHWDRYLGMMTAMTQVPHDLFTQVPVPYD